MVDQRPPSEGPLDDTLDSRSLDEEGTTGPIEDLVDFPVDNKKTLQSGEDWKKPV